MPDYCDTVAENPDAWFFEKGYCAAGAAVSTASSPAASVASQAVSGAQTVAGNAIAGAQQAAKQAAKGFGSLGSTKLDAGGVAALAALGPGEAGGRAPSGRGAGRSAHVRAEPDGPAARRAALAPRAACRAAGRLGMNARSHTRARAARRTRLSWLFPHASSLYLHLPRAAHVAAGHARPAAVLHLDCCDV